MSAQTDIFDTLLEPTFVINDKGAILYCNEPAALITQVSIRRLQRANSIRDIIDFGDETPDWFHHIQEIKDPTPYKELNFTSTGGASGKVQITAQPYTEIEGEKTWIVFFRDVTLEETLQNKYRAELDQKEEVILELRKARSALEDYSKNLEKMVEERTKELQDLNRTLSALLDSLGQGFFIFDKNGHCLPIYSKACERIVETNPAGKEIWEVLKIEDKKVENFRKWIFTLFSEMLPFEDIAALAPRSYSHSEGRHVELHYYPIRDLEGTLQHTVVMASDVTNEVQAKEQAALEKAKAEMVLKLVGNQRRTQSFIRESKHLLSELKKSVSQTQPEKSEVFRLLHTLKGAVATYSLKDTQELCHKAEGLLGAVTLEDPTSWEPVQKISRDIELKFHSFLKDHKKLIGDDGDEHLERSVQVKTSKVYEWLERIQDKLPQHLILEMAEDLTFEKAKKSFSHFNSICQDIAANQSKKLKPLHFINGDLLLPTEPYERLFESFIHIFRNSMDHGIERPEDRLCLGKEEEGQISIRFEKLHGNLLICIEDDGAGIDISKLKEKLITKGIDLSNQADEDIIQHIFDSELSTRDEVSDLSGRGVGMDAVMAAARELGGKAWVESELGKGIRVTIQVPFQLPPALARQKTA